MNVFKNELEITYHHSFRLTILLNFINCASLRRTLLTWSSKKPAHFIAYKIWTFYIYKKAVNFLEQVFPNRLMHFILPQTIFTVFCTFYHI